jgi:GNAT superfamily N-acetyltransferase
MHHREARVNEIAHVFLEADLHDVVMGAGRSVFAAIKSGGSTATIVYDGYMETERIWLDTLETRPSRRGKGDASRVLDQIFALADRLGLPVMLEAVPFGNEAPRMTLDTLVAWYAKHGFEPTKRLGTSCDMTRRPRVLANA